LGTCIDVGFGLERLEMVLNKTVKSKEETLIETVNKIIESGFKPSGNKQGYILRKLLRLCHQNGIEINHQFYRDEIIRQEKIINKYNKLKDKYKDKSKEWWYDTHGIDLDNI
jgi:alanyl-tRNA synthetase